MPTLYLRPNATGDVTQLSKSGGTYNWEMVDDESPDENATYVTHYANETFKYDLYHIPNHPSSAGGTINFIKVYVRHGAEATPPGYVYAFARTVIKTGGAEFRSGWFNSLDVAIDGYVASSQTYTTNPQTGVAWTWSDIDALQIGYDGRGDSVPELGCYAYPRGTQVYVEVDYTTLLYFESASVSIGVVASATRKSTFTRIASVIEGIVVSATSAMNVLPWLCIASKSSGSIKTYSALAAWTSCAKDAVGDLAGAYFTLYDNRLCVLRYQNIGFAYSAVNDITANWTDKPKFPNLPVRFTGMFAGKDANDNPILYFLTQKGMFYLDVFSNFIFGPTEITWEEDSTSGKKGLYWKGDTYVAVGKGIYKIHGADVTLVGPDMDDGLPEDMQGTITDMIGVGFWLVIAVDGGVGAKSSILKRYITGKHWHPVYVTSEINSPIGTLCWDSGNLYFGEGTNVKSLPFPTITDNVNKLSTQTRVTSGTLIYPYFHSVFETMPKVAHKVWATTRDCNANETITIHYRKDEETSWTSLGSFATSPRPTALSFGATGMQFERLQLRATYARGDTTTNSPKIETLTLEYRVVPPTLWGFDVRIAANTSNDRKGQDIIDALKTAIESKTLLDFYPSGDKSKQVYYVQVKGMPGNEKGTEFGTEGVYLLSLSEVIEP